jgi:hypothetical protein
MASCPFPRLRFHGFRFKASANGTFHRHSSAQVSCLSIIDGTGGANPPAPSLLCPRLMMVEQILCPCAVHDAAGTFHLRRAAVGDHQIFASIQMFLILEDVLCGNAPTHESPQYAPPGGPGHGAPNTAQKFQQRRRQWASHEQSPKAPVPTPFFATSSTVI